ncbi:hypothetical protein OUZ56_012421 [Daphnia magna]|uniref:Uncharacterized protein n=1 Tax=Daphnia magna TaxID=35525 RepID=A0ABQ9Z2Z3_9CRUS|nr:hypothetical protein OUZ56_012421 [Daphnia magna]
MKSGCPSSGDKGPFHLRPFSGLTQRSHGGSISSVESQGSHNRRRSNFSRERRILDQACEQELQDRELQAQRECEQHERDRRRRGDRRQDRDRSDTEESTRESLPQRKFAVPKRRMRVVRDWMTSTLSPSEAKQLRERYGMKKKD